MKFDVMEDIMGSLTRIEGLLNITPDTGKEVLFTLKTGQQVRRGDKLYHPTSVRTGIDTSYVMAEFKEEIEDQVAVRTENGAMPTVWIADLKLWEDRVIPSLPRGLKTYRLNHELSREERCFSKVWERHNNAPLDTDFLAKQLIPDMTDRDAEVAATIIQWLGTNVGQSFLRQVNVEILKDV